MKRILLSILGTVAGVVALLSFKTQGHPLATPAGGLPSAALTGGSGPTTSAPARTSAPPNPSKAGMSTSYVGTAVDTRYGVVQVKVSVAARKITDVSFVQLTAFDGRSQQINSQAAPILLQETLTAQSARIDGVSGASYTSQGYEQSLQSALDRAGY
ncbi:MAG: FMN-binding protein [Jatrophihabitantaceae bacterium]